MQHPVRVGAIVALTLAAAALCIAAASPSAPVAIGGPMPSAAELDPLVDSLLRADDLPSYLLPGGVDDPTPFDIDQDAFEANGGARAISQTWDSENRPLLAVVDFRMALSTPEDAAAYLDAAELVLSEATETGLTLVDDPPVAEDARHYSGSVDSIGESLTFDVYLFRVGPTAAKVFVATLDGSSQEAPSIARAAVERMGGAPAPTPDVSSAATSPTPEITMAPAASDTPVAQLLAHVPELIAPACHSDDSPFGLGTAVTCDSIDPVAVSYTLMADMLEVEAAFHEAQASMGVTPIAASCEEGPFVGRYDVAGLGSGQILCTTTGTEQVFVWNRDDLPILAFAVSDTFDFPQLYAWWLGAGPNP